MPSAIYDALLGSQYKKEESPYGIAGQLIAQGAPLLSTPYASTGSNLGYSIGASLLSALLGGWAENDTNRQNEALYPLQRELLGADPERSQALVKQEPRLSVLSNALAAADQESKIQAELAGRTARSTLKSDIAKLTIPGLASWNPELAVPMFKETYGIDVDPKELEGRSSALPYNATPLTEEQAIAEGEKLGLSPEDSLIRLKQVGDVDRVRRLGQFAGEQIKPLSDAHDNQLTAIRNFKANINDLISLVDDLSETSAERVARAKADTGSADFIFYARLQAAKQAFARAREVGVLTEQDIAQYTPLFEAIKILDKKGPIKERLLYLRDLGNSSAENFLTTLKQTGRNVSKIDIEEYAPIGGASTPPPAPEGGQQQVPPGMKLQRNKKTGETRLVPING